MRFEQHYDFGLRTIKSVLVYAGEVKLRCMKVKTRGNIDAEKAAKRLDDHLCGLKKIPVANKKKNNRKVSMGTALR